MLDLLKALDNELPWGSEVTLFNLRVTDAVIGTGSYIASIDDWLLHTCGLK